MKLLFTLLAGHRANLTAQQTALCAVQTKLPDPLKAELAGFGASLAEQLAKLPELEAEAQRIEAMQTELAGLKEQVSKGELLDRAKVDAALEEARAAVRTELAGEIRATRLGVAAAAGLPVPPDAVLALPAAEFNARLEQAGKNVKTIAERCAQPKARQTLVSRYAFCTPDQLAAELDSLADLLAPAARAADPLLGAGTPPPAAAAGKRHMVI